MNTSKQFNTLSIRPDWWEDLVKGENLVAYNCNKYGFSVPSLSMPLWEGTGNIAYDYSGNRYHGTLMNGTTWTSGMLGNAVAFNGVDGYINNGTSLSVTKPFVISALINPTSYDNYRNIICKGEDYIIDSGYQFQLFLLNGTGNVSLYSLLETLSFAYSPPLGVWTHLTVVINDTSTTLYVNGIFQQSLGIYNLGTGISSTLYIGTSWSQHYDPFLGSIDNIVIFNNFNPTSEQIKFLSDNPYFMYESLCPSIQIEYTVS